MWKIERLEEKMATVVGRADRAVDEALKLLTEEDHSRVTSGEALAGEMTSLPVHQGSGGSLFVSVDNVGIGLVLYAGENMLVTEWECPPNATFGVPHWHPSTELLHVISGSCEYPDLGKVVQEGETSVVPAGEPHVWKSGADGCRMIVVWSPPLPLEVS